LGDNVQYKEGHSEDRHANLQIAVFEDLAKSANGAPAAFEKRRQTAFLASGDASSQVGDRSPTLAVPGADGIGRHQCRRG
jgi:hypothetical protein